MLRPFQSRVIPLDRRPDIWAVKGGHFILTSTAATQNLNTFHFKPLRMGHDGRVVGVVLWARLGIVDRVKWVFVYGLCWGPASKLGKVPVPVSLEAHGVEYEGKRGRATITKVEFKGLAILCNGETPAFEGAELTVMGIGTGTGRERAR